MSVAIFMAIVNGCRGVKNFVQDGGLQDLSDKIPAKRLEYEAKETATATQSPDGGCRMNTTMIACNNCGTDIDDGAHFCSKCGSSITSSACRACGSVEFGGGQFCSKCGASQSQSPAISRPNPATSGRDLAGFPVYYQQEFRKIESSGEAYKGKWNWAAFCFGGIWALTKGLWLPTLICFIGAIFTGGIVGVAFWFVFGARGNYMYYCKEIKHRDLPV
jgi:RNA polymerase subunit RPABC4/transcription elongation factor Spt4